MKNKIDSLNFQPWMPESYLKNKGIYGRLLILGESHYMEDEDEIEEDMDGVIKEIENKTSSNELTSVIIEGYIHKKWDIRFYRNIGLLFNAESIYEVWQNVAFANLIQVALKKSDAQPSEEEIKTAVPTFWTLLENLKPEKVLVCSQRMWKNWMKLTGIDDDIRSKSINELKVNGKFSKVWNFNYLGGSCTAIGINHPSSRGFSYREWSPLVKEFLAMK